VVLYSVSMKAATDRAVAYKSIDRAVNGKKPVTTGAARDGKDIETLPTREIEKIKHDVQTRLQQFANPGITVTIDSRGLVISLAAVSFFSSGDATINQSKLPVLDSVLDVLNPLPNQIRIEGFTDSIPIKNERFADNWDLSAARAGNVLRYVIEHSTIAPDHLSLAGYGPYRPVGSNDTEEGRSRNRRVDIIIPPLLREESKQYLPEVRH
jgi:chemotaxis protein MotB